MNYKEQIETLIDQLKFFGFNRRTIEQTLSYSENSIDQSLARGGTARLLTGIKMLLELETLRKVASKTTTEEEAKLPGIDKKLQELHSNLVETRHIVELNHALLGAGLNLCARLEALAVGEDYLKAAERLSEATTRIFEDMHQKKARTSEANR
jgi:hypothetical protein